MRLSELQISENLKQSLYNLYDLLEEHYHLTEEEALELMETVVGSEDVHDLMLDFIDEERILRELFPDGTVSSHQKSRK